MLTSFALGIFLIGAPAPSLTNLPEQPIETKKCPTVQIKGPKTRKGAGSIIYRGVVENSVGTPVFKWVFDGAVVSAGEGTGVITVDPIAWTVKATLVVENVPSGCKPSSYSLRTKIIDVRIHPPPVVTSIKLTPSVITRPCPTATRADTCSADVSEVHAEVNASAPDDGTLLFTWVVTAGRLIGSGRSVKWDLTGVANGTYQIAVEVNFFGAMATQSASLTISDCRGCNSKSP